MGNHTSPNTKPGCVVLIFSWKKDGRSLDISNKKIRDVNSAQKPFFFGSTTCVLRFLQPHRRSDPIRSEISRRCGGFFSEKGQTWPAQWLPRAFGDVFLLGGFLTRSRIRDTGDASEIRRLHPVDMVNIPSIYRVSAPCWVVFSLDF